MGKNRQGQNSTERSGIIDCSVPIDMKGDGFMTRPLFSEFHHPLRLTPYV